MAYGKRRFQGSPLEAQKIRRRTPPEQGAALVMVLILTTIALIFTAGMLHMVTTGAQMSGGKKRYRTSLEAAKGANVLVKKAIDTRGGTNPDPGNITLSSCLANKLQNATAAWSTSGCAPCDMTVTMGDYNICAKVVGTTVGNSAQMNDLVITGVVLSGSGNPQSGGEPYHHTIEFEAQHNVIMRERAILQVLYQF